jgi:hypothetical protein
VQQRCRARSGSLLLFWGCTGALTRLAYRLATLSHEWERVGGSVLVAGSRAALRYPRRTDPTTRGRAAEPAAEAPPLPFREKGPGGEDLPAPHPTIRPATARRALTRLAYRLATLSHEWERVGGAVLVVGSGAAPRPPRYANRARCPVRGMRTTRPSSPFCAARALERTCARTHRTRAAHAALPSALPPGLRQFTADWCVPVEAARQPATHSGRDPCAASSTSRRQSF